MKNSVYTDFGTHKMSAKFEALTLVMVKAWHTKRLESSKAKRSNTVLRTEIPTRKTQRKGHKFYDPGLLWPSRKEKRSDSQDPATRSQRRK
jgi:hypothetical protein